MTKFRQYAVPFVVASVIVFAASCGNNDDTVPPTPTTTVATTTSSTTPTTWVAPSTTTPSPLELRWNELMKMTPEQCRATNARKFLGLADAPNKDTRTQFRYDCVSHNWGWYAKGPVDHVWAPSTNLTQLMAKHGNMVPIDEIGIPRNLRNPLFAAPASLGDLKVGSTYCLHFAPKGGQASIRTQFKLTDLYALLVEQNGRIVAKPTFEMEPDLPEGMIDGFASQLESIGVIPTQDGWWSGNHITVGRC